MGTNFLNHLQGSRNDFQPFADIFPDPLLGVPFYLHPREPLVTRQQAYEGHAWLVGSAWGFGAETAVHALRPMGSGLFDEYPKLRIILGHLGEGVPFSIWRVDYRVSTMANANLRPKTKVPMSEYLRENFYITTSGNFRTQALIDVMMEVGADRVNIAYANAQQLFHL